MAFLGIFGNYSKPGPGVSKEEEVRSPISKYLVVYHRRFSKFIQLNLTFMIPVLLAIVASTALFFAPVSRYVLSVTFGNYVYELNTWNIYVMTLPFFLLSPFWGGVMVVARRLAKEEYCFIWSEYWKGVKENWKQFFVNGIVLYIIYVLASFSLIYYNTMVYENLLFFVPMGLIICMILSALFTQYYVGVLIVSMELKLKQIYKNAFIFSVLGWKKNLICSVALLIPCAIIAFCLLFNIISMLIAGILLIFVFFSFQAYSNCYICYPVFVKYVVNPPEDTSNVLADSIMKDETFEESIANIAKKAEEQKAENEAPKYVYVNGKLIRSDELDKD
ncbi:MAG: hypothetical protein R3Y35_07725 [Clostridia bacterium]